jgi:hypothetical protein
LKKIQYHDDRRCKVKDHGLLELFAEAPPSFSFSFRLRSASKRTSCEASEARLTKGVSAPVTTTKRRMARLQLWFGL